MIRTLFDGLMNIDFLSWQFYFVLIVLILMFWLVTGKCRKALLIIVSTAFYFLNGINSVVLLLYLILSSWVVSHIMPRTKKKKLLLVLGIVVVVAPFIVNRILQMNHLNELLAARRYYHYFLSSIGLAYTTMMAVSYIVDVYVGRYSGVKFVNYVAVLSFFPYAVSGPIERIHHMDIQMEQIENKKFSWRELQAGAILIVYGLFVKLVVADRIGILVNEVFDHYTYYLGLELLFALFLYGIEIYCDFSACSDIARGVARCFGINIINNFEQPYFSKNIGEFWRRWHRSLSFWLRDYVYIPLGGNRKGKIRKCINICITFIASGLWHGFNVHYIVWGGIHGIYQAIGILTSKLRGQICRICNINRDTIGHKCFQIIITFFLTDFAWLFFRVEHISDAINIIKRIVYGIDFSFLVRGYLYLGLNQQEWNVLILGGGIILLVDILHYIFKEQLIITFLNENIYIRYGIFLVLFVFTVVFGIYGSGYNSASFIYRGF